MKLNLILLIFVLLTACFQKQPEKKTNYIDTSYIENGSYQDKSCHERIVDNDFAYRPLGNDISIKRIKLLISSSYNLTVKAQPDNYDSQKIDTIFVFKSQKSNLIFRKVKGDEDISAFESACIKDNLITFDRGVHVGIRKADFLKLFKNANNITCDSIKIDSEDQTFDNWFIFKEDTLNMIIWGSNL